MWTSLSIVAETPRQHAKAVMWWCLCSNLLCVDATHTCAHYAQETSYGVLRPPLGSVRLTIIELVAVLLRTGCEEAETAIIDSSAVQEVLQVFLRFPFNSILHHQAGPYSLVHPMCIHIAFRCSRGRDIRLLTWLVNADPIHGTLV